MFAFGKNWQNYVLSLNEEKIHNAKRSLQNFLGLQSLRGKRFLDAGSGSGLFSLVARQLGAKVVSFDVDEESVNCTKGLKNRFYPTDRKWEIKKGSLLNNKFVSTLGKFDIVYCWGVAHHTGKMHEALANIAPLCPKNGLLYLAIYNDQGRKSIKWEKIKFHYNQLPKSVQLIYALRYVFAFEFRNFAHSLIKLNIKEYLGLWKDYDKSSGRGMSRWNDYVDWIGGYPFEVAKPEVIFDLYRSRGYELLKIKTCGGGLGNNEYLFKKN